MTLRRALAFALLLSPAPLFAQTSFQPVTLSDADALAEQVRRLGANPLDLSALLTAGELSVRLDDLNAAGAFFTRAEKIDPRSPRAKAGEAAILVRSERPAEALRYFAEAERLGLPVARMASDRGLAYDLLGDPGRAQRDYKAALAVRDDPETRRRYALSLGIAGRQAQALDELAPLIRQNDRAAWRSRAFVLAMGGDAAEASRIAQTMMPPGAAAGLQGFFAQLSRLPAVDRAFAVHFGEVRPTPQRLADARLAPRDAPLALEPLPVQVAAVAAPARPDRRDRKRDRRRSVQVAAVLPTPAPVAAPLPSPPAYQAPAYRPPAYTSPVARTPLSDRPLTAGEQASLAAAGIRGLPSRSGAPIYPPPARVATPAERASLAAAGGRSAVPPVQLAAATPRPAPIIASRVTTAPAPAFNAPPPNFASAVRTGAPVAPAVSLGRMSATPVASAATTPVGTTPPAPLTRPAQATAGPAATGALVSTSAGAPASLPALPLPRREPAVAASALLARPPAVQLSPAIDAAPAPQPASQAVAGTAGTQPVAAPGFSTSPISPATGGTAPAANMPAPVATAGLAATALPGAGGVGITAASPGTTDGEVVAAAPVPATDGNMPANTLAAPLATTELASAAPLSAPRPAFAPPAAVPTSPPVALAPAPKRRPRLGHGEADSILAKIVAGLTIPATELDVAGPGHATPGEGKRLTARERRAARQAAPAKEVAAEPVKAKPLTARERRAAARQAATDDEVAANDTAKGKPLTARQRRAAARLTAAASADDETSRPANNKKSTAATRKALADKKAAADKKALADKEAAEAKRVARAEPPRIWVQVAGGANEAGLANAWQTMKGKAPGALAGRKAYTTPLRATNRVLTGPFKTEAEARAYVNQLAKSGVNAFTFTSGAGQKVTKLDTK